MQPILVLCRNTAYRRYGLQLAEIMMASSLAVVAAPSRGPPLQPLGHELEAKRPVNGTRRCAPRWGQFTGILR